MKRTIYTIAAELGLSPGTISKVINRTGNVSEETRERVLAYIKEVGYVPVTSARMLKSKRSYTIGVVFSEDLHIGLEHPFFSSILQHFKNYVENEGYELSFIVSKLGSNRMSYYEWCMNKKVDGVYIVVGDYRDEGLYELAKKHIPCVSTDILIPGFHSIISDNVMGIRVSLDHLYQTNHLNTVGMIAGPQQSKAFNERYDAFLSYHQEKNILINPDHVLFAESFGFTSGYQAALKLLEKPLPQGLLVGSDDIALGVLKAFKDNHIDIPNDIQIIGFDDIAFAKHFTPSLTTVKQDRELIATTAAKQLLELINNPNAKVEEVIRIPVELVLRETTK